MAAEIETIEARDLCLARGTRRALENVNLTLRRGEVVGLIGPNGAGKSTLMRVLAGILPPSAGAVTYDGTSAGQIGRRRLAQTVAWLAQAADGHGDEHAAMRALDIVALGRLPHRRPFGGMSPEDHAAIGRALAAADCQKLSGRALGSLSGGERMRVLLARALAVEAPFLLADEPAAALDPFHQLQVMALLQQRAHAGAGVLVTLHDLALASRFCDRLVLLSAGRKIADGPPDMVLSDPMMAGAFRVRVARARHEGRDFVVPWMALDGEP